MELNIWPVYKQIEEMVPDTGSESERSAKAHALFETVSRYLNAAEELASAASQLAGDMTRLDLKARDAARLRPVSVNSLGEVQSRGSQVDRLCALLAERNDQLRLMCHAVGVDCQKLVARVQESQEEGR